MSAGLSAIFAHQTQLMEKSEEIERQNSAPIVPPHLRGKLDNRVVQLRIKALAYWLVEELAEGTHELKNKPWKQTTQPTNVPAFKEELVDALHFLVEIFITAGMSADEVFALYLNKHAINMTRQEEGY